MGTPNSIRSRQQRLPEENILAILNVIGVKEQDDIRDDRLSFLAATRAVCITQKQHRFLQGKCTRQYSKFLKRTNPWS